MKTFLKTLIGGAIGLGALYIVGKVCYEAGKDVAEVEHQLKEAQSVRPDPEPTAKQNDIPAEQPKAVAESPEEAAPEKVTVFSRMATRIQNAKMFLKVKKAFSKDGKSPGVLSTLLNNPEGAKIEAFVMDGGVRINVRPRAA